jgi:hypothetical protein
MSFYNSSAVTSWLLVAVFPRASPRDRKYQHNEFYRDRPKKRQPIEKS